MGTAGAGLRQGNARRPQSGALYPAPGRRGKQRRVGAQEAVRGLSLTT